MKDDNIYNPPQSDLKESGHGKVVKKSFIRRFIVTNLWCFPILLSTVLLSVPRSAWLYGVVGSVVLSLASGVIAMMIPTRYKSIYVTVGVISVLVFSYWSGSK